MFRDRTRQTSNLTLGEVYQPIALSFFFLEILQNAIIYITPYGVPLLIYVTPGHDPVMYFQ